MNDGPRVLWVNPWDKRIGPNRYLADMLAVDTELARRTIVAGAADDAAAEEYRALGCTVETWPEARLVRTARSAENAAQLLRTHTRGVWRARTRMRELAPDVVITNSENVWFGGMAARALGIPHLQVFHALTLEHHWGRQAARGYLEWLKLWNDAFVAVSPTVAEMLKRNGARRVVTVPNGLNLAAVRAASLAPLPEELTAQLGGRYPVVVTLGRVSAVKGHDLLVASLERIKAEFPQVLWIAAGALLSGEGIEDTAQFMRTLKERVAARGLESNLLWPGEIEYAPALLRRADLYVQPSRTESFCRAIVEAMACGAPVAAFAAGALPDVVGEAGLVVPAEDTEALGAAVCRLARDGELRARLRGAGAARAEQFDVRESANVLNTVVNRIAAAGVPRAARMAEA